MGCGDAESVDAESAFTAWVNRKSDGQVTSTGAILKKGRDVMKTVQTRYFGHAPDGEPELPHFGGHLGQVVPMRGQGAMSLSV